MSITRYEPKPIKNRLIALLVIGVLIFGITKLFPDNPPAFLEKISTKAESSTPNSIRQLKSTITPNKLNKDFNISEVKMVYDDSWPRLTGLIKNISKRDLQDITLEVNTYKSNNKLIQTHYLDAYFLEAGQSWKFEMSLLDKNAAFYDIASISGKDATDKINSTSSLKVVSSELRTEGEDQYITGIIENKSKMHFDEATVEMSIMDKTGTVMQYSSANILCFEPGQKWKFKVDVYGYIADSYKLTKVEGEENPNFQHFAPSLQILNPNLYSAEYDTNIKGTIKNNSLNSYSYVSLTINVFDKDGCLLKSLYDSRTGLSSGSSWKFDVSTSEENVKSFKIVEIRAN